MKLKEFREEAHRLVDWMADYLENIEQYPVKSQVAPRAVIDQLPDEPPPSAQAMETIMRDFEKTIMPGMTHWQSPNFFAYFPANSSPPSVLAEMLTATLGAQCMIWETSPAAAELEEQMMEWLKQMTGLPQSWHGVIQPTASDATLAALLTAREKATSGGINKSGFSGKEKFRIYASSETHSSIEKGVRIAGFGSDNLVKIAVTDTLAMDPTALEQAIEEDREKGYQPLAVVATLGSTGTTAMDPLEPIAALCAKHKLWLHVDAAYAGSALLLEEYRPLLRGIEQADSFVFNPHKWLLTNFDCSAYFVKDKEALLGTFEITPEYLKTDMDKKVNNYRDWGIPLGRRFRALKLWFVIRSYGVDGLKAMLREHIRIANHFADEIEAHRYFELAAPVTLNLVCFRLRPSKHTPLDELNRLNAELLKRINATGKVYLTHTKIGANYTLRLVCGQTRVTEQHVQNAWRLIQDTADTIIGEKGR